MEPPRQKFLARAALLLLAALGALWLGLLDYEKKISTNVIDLIPTDERAPELSLVRSLTDQQQARVILLSLSNAPTAPNAPVTPNALVAASASERSEAPSLATPPPTPASASAPSLPSSALQPSAPPPAAVEAFATALRNSPALASVVVLGDTADRDRLGRFVFERRFDLLLPSWLADRHHEFATASATPPSTPSPLPSSPSVSVPYSLPATRSSLLPPSDTFSPWLAEKTAAALDAFLARPESIAFQELVPHDPLLLVPTLLENLQGIGAAGTTGASSPGRALVWALVKDSPFSEAGQQPVFAAIEHALAEARRTAPALELRWTGVNRFAAESRARIESEISWLNTLSLIVVLGVACVFVRRLWKVLHLIPVVVLSTGGAWVVTTLVFDRVHILVFVVGSLLAGVAIDYGFYLYMQPALRPDEPYREKLRRLLKPLLTSCLTTVIGFSLLFFSELPLVRQLGVFVSAGLISALVVAILYFAQLDRVFLETRTFTLPNSARSRRFITPLFILAALIAVVGFWRLDWRDDIRQLEIPAPALGKNDEEVRALFGDSTERTAYLTRGDTPALARAALEKFTAWHDAQFPATTAASAGFVLPTDSDFRARAATLAELKTFSTDLPAALERHGYTSESFAPFLTAWETLLTSASAPSSSAPALPSTLHPLSASVPTSASAPTSASDYSLPATHYSLLVADLRRELTGPLSLLFHLDPAGGPSWFLTLADHPPGATPPPALTTFSVDQLQSLNSLFTRYRISAARLSAIGLSLVGLSVFVLYGFRRGIRIFMIPAGSCFFALGLLGLFGHQLNIFHLLAAFLGVCLSHNYAIFSAENANRNEPPPPSIRLSALTTAGSFGVLALSKIPVVSALGATVGLIVITALLMVELEPLRR